MSPQPENKRIIGIALIVIFFGIVVALISSARDAAIRSAARKLQNPAPGKSETLAVAKANYDRHCADCHGTDGNGQGSKAHSLWKAPTDFRKSQETRQETDGELYWSITRGSWPMSAFDGKLSDVERWQLVNYLRTFARP
jgi:mono/diheme cytochrome c family protein